MTSVFDDELGYDDDRSVRSVEAYLACGELLMSDDDIRAEFADIGRLSDAGVAWAREQARLALFVNFRRDMSLSLETVGDFHGMSRERMRQVEEDAMRKIRTALCDTGQEDWLRADLRDRDTRRQATWAERNDQEAPGDFGLSEWTERNSMMSLAKRSDRESDVSSRLVASAQRGNAAAQRTRRARSA